MNNILSGISGYFSKSLILGTLLPVVMFSTLAWLVAVPVVPPEVSFFKPLEALEAQWKLLAYSFLMIVLAGFLYNVNTPLIRLYEGYPWSGLWIGKRRKAHFQRRFRILQAQWQGMPWLEYKLGQLNGADSRIGQVQDKKSAAGRNLKSEFPEEEKLILPTRLGNVIRSFENYTNLQYQIEAVTMWPRLVAKIDKDYAASIDDAKTSFDFMLNCSALSTVLAFLLLLASLLYPAPLASMWAALAWAAEVLIFCAVAVLFYRLAINRAKAWGNTVKGSFDLYRWDLLKQLGYSRLPRTVKEERDLWLNISQRMTYGDSYLVPPAEYSPRTTFAEAEPNFATLEIARGIDMPGETGELVVKLWVRNASPYNVTGVVITDTLADDFQYKWDTATVENASSPGHVVVVAGINPYRFSVGSLNINEKLTLTYKGLLVKKEVKESKGEQGQPAENRMAVNFRWLEADPPDGSKKE